MSELSNVQVHPTAIVDDGAVIGGGTKIWHFSHISSGAVIGKQSNFGQNCFVAPNVQIGSNVKVQNNVSIYEGVRIEDDVFLGPSCVLTNVSNPRSQVYRKGLFEPTHLKRGATVGANATIVCGVTLGRYSFIAAGAVVTKNVPDYGFMVGSPARQKGWMTRHGHRIHDSSRPEQMVCRESGFQYYLNDCGELRCVDLKEEEPLSPEDKLGNQRYRDFK